MIRERSSTEAAPLTKRPFGKPAGGQYPNKSHSVVFLS
jgi:hypothetical protein